MNSSGVNIINENASCKAVLPTVKFALRYKKLQVICNIFLSFNNRVTRLQKRKLGRCFSLTESNAKKVLQIPLTVDIQALNKKLKEIRPDPSKPLIVSTNEL